MTNQKTTQNPFGRPTHGSASTYRNWKCRCRKCKAAHAEEQRIQTEKRAARLRGDAA